MNAGDILGHEPMGIVREVGPTVTNLAVGDQVVIPFQISCGSCYMCDQQLFTQCETTQAATRGWVLHCSATPNSTARFPAVKPSCSAYRKPSSPTSRSRTGRRIRGSSTLCDVLPTAWQAVAYADIRDGGSVAVLGLGPIGDMAARIAQSTWAIEVIAVDRVPERLARARLAACTDRLNRTSTTISPTSSAT